MSFSTRTRYSLRALADLALHQSESPVRLREVAERQKLSLGYLRQLVMPLEAAGLVRSVRGAKGGYFLARPADEITVAELVGLFEGPFAPAECTSSSGRCEMERDCGAKSLWIEIKEAVERILQGTTVADIALRCRKGRKGKR